MNRRCGWLLVGALLVPCAEARAQSGRALADVLIGPSYEGALTENVSKVLYNNLVLTEATTFPIGSSSGGFTWTFDPSLGVQTRRSQSFGPMFVDRPLTTGRGKLNVSI